MSEVLSARKKSLVEQPIQKILVGVAGGSAAGKTTLCENIYRQMAFDRNFKVEIISLDSFYKNVDKSQVDIREYNFDHPNALDFDLAYKTLQSLIELNEPVPIPQYSFIEHARQKEPSFVGPANIIFFEGLMAFYDKRIRELLTYKIFINCDDDIRLCRRLKRDTVERGRSVISVLEQYNKFVKNAFRDFILPSIVYADIIIPGFRNNRVSVDFIVQHIKNIARRITFKERAVKTRTFIFGESEIYDLECTGSYDIKATLEQESFLVFPTSNEHKKELEFFLTLLLSEIFSVDYFHEVYINQFIKVLKALLSQLIALKGFSSAQMEIFSIYNMEELLMLECNSYPVKVVFFPVAELEHAKDKLVKIKAYLSANPKTTFIILNAFCDMSVPNMIYKLHLSNVIMVNLFVIANDKRFREIMTNNISATTDSFDWFLHNHDIANEAVAIISREFSFYRRSEQQIAFACYLLELHRQKTKMFPRTVDESLEQLVRQSNEKQLLIRQYQVCPQQHENLCGYHALSTVLNLQAGKSLTCREVFVQNYHLLANSIGRVDYTPLERSEVPVVLGTELLRHADVGVLIYSCKFVQNSEQQVQELQGLFDDLAAGRKLKIYVLLGVHNHYVLTRITQHEIAYYDSSNISLRAVFSGELAQAEKRDKELVVRLRNMKEALEILADLLSMKTTVQRVLVEKRIDDIVGSFDLVKHSQTEIDNWLLNEYPKPVIESELLRIVRERKVELDEAYRSRMREWLAHPRMASLFHQGQKLLF